MPAHSAPKTQVAVNTSLTATPAQQIAQLQQAQMATAQQMGMVQATIQQMVARLSQVRVYLSGIRQCLCSLQQVFRLSWR